MSKCVVKTTRKEYEGPREQGTSDDEGGITVCVVDGASMYLLTLLRPYTFAVITLNYDDVMYVGTHTYVHTYTHKVS